MMVKAGGSRQSIKSGTSGKVAEGWRNCGEGPVLMTRGNDAFDNRKRGQMFRSKGRITSLASHTLGFLIAPRKTP